MGHDVRFTVELSIHDGKFDAFQTLADTMISGTRKEPGALGYEWHLSSDRKRCRLIETYKDAEAVMAHLSGAVVQQFVPKMFEITTLDRFEVYGDPGPKAREILAGVGAEIFPLWRGLNR